MRQAPPAHKQDKPCQFIPPQDFEDTGFMPLDDKNKDRVMAYIGIALASLAGAAWLIWG